MVTSVRNGSRGDGAEPLFDVRLTPSGDGVVRAAVSGELDLATTDLLFEILSAALRRDGVRGMYADLGQVRLLDASAVGVLLAVRNLAESLRVPFRVDGASGLPRRVLEITGVLDLLGGKA